MLHGGARESIQLIPFFQLQEARDLNERARRTLVGMARRVMTDRLIQVSIVGLEVAIIGFLVYWKFLK